MSKIERPFFKDTCGTSVNCGKARHKEEGEIMKKVINIILGCVFCYGSLFVGLAYGQEGLKALIDEKIQNNELWLQEKDKAIDRLVEVYKAEINTDVPRDELRKLYNANRDVGSATVFSGLFLAMGIKTASDHQENPSRIAFTFSVGTPLYAYLNGHLRAVETNQKYNEIFLMKFEKIKKTPNSNLRTSIEKILIEYAIEKINLEKLAKAREKDDSALNYTVNARVVDALTATWHLFHKKDVLSIEDRLDHIEEIKEAFKEIYKK